MDLMEYINGECDKPFGQVAFCKVARGLLMPCFENPPPWGLRTSPSVALSTKIWMKLLPECGAFEPVFGVGFLNGCIIPWLKEPQEAKITALHLVSLPWVLHLNSLTLWGCGFMVMGGEGKTISALGLGLNHHFLGCDKHG